MKFSRSIVLAVALIFAWATAGFAAHSAEICQKRIESFNYLVDYSGSMMMNFPSVGKTKMAVAKEVIKRVNDMVPELGYQGGLYTFAPYGAVVNQGPWVRSTLAAGVDSLKDNLETFARFTPMGDGIQAHNGIISQMTPRAAVILVSDGESNRGISPIDEVKAIYAANPNVCFHVISVASSPEGQATLDAIAALNACSVSVKAIDLLKKVGIPEAETRIDYYPHQFSGGQKQRIVIAMALVLNPGLILADEPTTALDVTVQAEILDLLRLARDEFDASVLIITHNMGVIADIADQVVVMYRGHVVEQGDVESIFYHPSHPYTQRLLAAVPRIGQKLVVRDVDGKPIDRTSDWHDEPLAVEAKGLTITYPGHLMQPDFVAVDGIDFAIHRSEVLGLVGESGSGKSTTGRAIAGLQKVSGGSLNVLGVEMNGVRERDFKPKRADIGFVFQDPGSSFNPLMTIAENVAEPLIVHRKYSSVADAKEYVGDLLEMVQLPRAYMSRFPHELSGGQRQRASLARALALKPSLLIADEPTSALDVSVQAKVLELFKKLQVEIGFACLFITHDLAVVDMLADRIMVMHKGRIVEHGDADDIMQRPSNQYTKKLLASLPVPDPREQQKHRAHLHELLAAENAA